MKLHVSTLFFLILSLLSLFDIHAQKVVLLPYNYMQRERDFFQKDTLWDKLRIKLKQKRGLDLRLYAECKIEPNDIIVSFNLCAMSLKLISQYPHAKHILYIFEPPTTDLNSHNKNNHAYFQKVLTWNDDLVDGRKYFKYYLPMMLNLPHNLPQFNERKLCCTVLANKRSSYPLEIYSERRSIIKFLDSLKNDDFHLYGQGWSAAEFSCYRGAPHDKEGVIKQYKFCICYENTRDMNGYVTEKMFECLSAGTVPIYLGAKNIESYVPKNCFIDRRDFGSNQELYDYLKNINEETYNGMLMNIVHFLESQQAKLYSWDNFIETFVDGV